MAERAILNNGDTSAYGSGFFVGKYRGQPRIFHDGNDAGFETFVEYFPAQRLGIAVLSNQLNSNPAGKAGQIANMYLPPPAAATPNKSSNTYLYVKTKQSYLAAYSGNYETPGGNLVKVYTSDTSLIIKFPDDEPQHLKALNDTVFKVFDDMLITFSKKSKNEFQQIGLKTPSFSNTAGRVEYVDYTNEALKAFTGTYYSEEIQTVYEIKIVDGHLAMYNIMNGNIPLTAKTKDRFAANAWYANKVVFTRDASQKVISFRISSGRVKNVLFVRIN